MFWRVLSLALLLIPTERAFADPDEAEWGYHGAIGPVRWAELDPEFERCGNGRNQSPIDLSDAELKQNTFVKRVTGQESLHINVEARARTMDLLDNGHTIQISSDASMGLMLDGDVYSLVQFHFHAPSEHTLNGQQLPLEVHFVMSNANGELAVIGELYEIGSADPAFDPIVGALPSGPGEARHLEDLALELSELKPFPEQYFAYSGSLTTPPCSEGVHWLIMAEVASLSKAQLTEIADHLHDNARPVQPRNGRDLLLISP